MASAPTSGPGASVVACKQTAITSAQLKALFTVPVAVSPTPRSDQIIAPVTWAAVATDSDTAYVNGPGGTLVLGYPASGGAVNLPSLLSNLTSGATSFAMTRNAELDAPDAVAAAGVALSMFIDTGNLTTGDFGITFTLFYAIVPAS